MHLPVEQKGGGSNPSSIAMNEFTIGQYIDKYRDDMWLLWDDSPSDGVLYVRISHAEEIKWMRSNAPCPSPGNLVLAIHYDDIPNDYIAIYHVSRHGGQSLIKDYIGR